MSRTETAIRTQVPVTFRKHTKYAITYAAGSIFTDWTPAAEGDELTISRGKHSTVISMDDATPVEWDDLDQMWIDA